MSEESEHIPLVYKIDIPSEFFNTVTGHHFDQCTMCETHLGFDTMYLIEKACKRVNSTLVYTLFEYAICLDCTLEMHNRMSKHSVASLQKFMAEKSHISSQRRHLEEDNLDYSNWLKTCVVNQKAATDLQEYNICGMFQGDSMILGDFPYLMSIEALEEMVKILSKETKDELDDFKRKHLGGPPEFEELFKNRPILVV
ncbi:MAG: hypothetical protein KDC83_06340 [Flavobacteriales bacterium]|nr:hypothetical protein [Flavobacteriales bacterium]